MEQALGIVVRGVDWSETSRIVTLWTREFGKVRALAKGGRRLRSNFDSAFDLLTVCNVVMIRKHSGSLDLLTEARVAERFPSLRTNLAALNVGYYIAELLADGTQDGDPHPALFDAAIHHLRSLQTEGISLPATVSAFELAWLQELGYSPRLSRCAVCDSDLDSQPKLTARLAFSPQAGGVVCAVCIPVSRDARLMTVAAWQALRALHRGEGTLPEELRREVRHILSHAVSSILGRRPRLLSYVDGG
jgi:DNA repair protein RecO (recombination protein O)